MATEDKRIDQLPAVSALDLTSLLAMQQGIEAKKVTLQQLLNFLNENVDTQNVVLYVAQSLTDEQKLQARTNIGAAAVGEGGGGGTVANAVLYVAQTLTEDQQHQARQNILCGSVGRVANDCVASGRFNHAEGTGTKASGGYGSHAEGHGTTASAYHAHAEGWVTVASGDSSHSEGFGTVAYGGFSHAEGYDTRAMSMFQHVQGKYNVPDSSEKYAHIVGNGTADDARSNAHTLDWDGVPWFAGDRIMLGGTGMDDENAVALRPIFVEQELNEEQKAQARKNIGAAAAGQMELIRQFQLTEDVSSMDITTDDAGNAFRLESAIMTLTTDGICAEGSSGALKVNFGTANNPYFIRWYNAGGFPWRGYQLGETTYRNSGFTVWGSAKGGVLLTIGQAGDLGNANGLGMVLYPSYGYNPDVKIERITMSGKLPANATVKIYGERVVEE